MSEVDLNGICFPEADELRLQILSLGCVDRVDERAQEAHCQVALPRLMRVKSALPLLQNSILDMCRVT